MSSFHHGMRTFYAIFGLMPTFKGSECPCRFFVLRALHTTRSRGPGRRRSTDDGVGHHRPARSPDRPYLIGSEPLGQIRPTPPPPLVSLSCLCSLGAAGHACAGTAGPVAGSRYRPASQGLSAWPRPPCVQVSP